MGSIAARKTWRGPAWRTIKQRGPPESTADQSSILQKVKNSAVSASSNIEGEESPGICPTRHVLSWAGNYCTTEISRVSRQRRRCVQSHGRQIVQHCAANNKRGGYFCFPSCRRLQTPSFSPSTSVSAQDQIHDPLRCKTNEICGFHVATRHRVLPSPMEHGQSGRRIRDLLGKLCERCSVVLAMTALNMEDDADWLGQGWDLQQVEKGGR